MLKVVVGHRGRESSMGYRTSPRRTDGDLVGGTLTLFFGGIGKDTLSIRLQAYASGSTFIIYLF